MTVELFPFQQEDVAKLSKQNNVLIANEMGTGKTFEAVFLDTVRRSQGSGPTLVVAPLSVLTSWADHFKLIQPELKVVRLVSKKRDSSWKEFLNLDADVFITHWESLRLMPELANVKWNHVIADECHRGQNRQAKQTKALWKIPAKHKTGLSGTPVTNTPDKLWANLRWLYPKVYKSYWRFFNEYVDFDVEYARGVGYKKPKGPINVAQLHEELAPFYVRHRKKEKCCEHHPFGVMADLPDKYYSTIEVELDPKQRKAYESMRKDMIAWVGLNEDKPLVAPVVIAQLVRLQQFALGYATVTESGIKLSDPSSKIDALMQLIEDNPTEQFVVFSQFSQAINIANARLANAKVSVESITGATPDKLRGGIIERFQAGKARIFTGTIAAGGVGITLTSANKVVFLDRAWSPSQNFQAEDRLHRHGQTNNVQVIDIMAKDTIDLGRKAQIEQRWLWIKELLGDK